MDDSDQSTKRPVVSDGKTDREIWRPEDGNGDANFKTYEETQHNAKGHPSWKLYCGDAPENIEGVLIEPPKNCYLDDRAAYKLLNWDGYTKAERGRFWRNDFSNKGDIRPHRKHRGRPAFMLGGDIAHLEGRARVYRLTGAEHPNDIAIINREIASQKESKALARLMPSTAIARAKSPPQTGAGASKQLKRIPSSPTNTNSNTDPNHVDREPSPFTADLHNSTQPNPAKRPRLDSNTRPMPSTTTQPMALIAELKSHNLALTERNETLSAKTHALTRTTTALQTELTSTKTLWKATTNDLTTLRAQYLASQTALRSQAAGEETTTNLQAIRNDLTIYRNLAKDLYAKLQTGAAVLGKGVAAVKGVEKLALDLGIATGEKIPLAGEYGVIRGDLEEIGESMGAVLGEEWGKFVRQVEAEREELAVDVWEAAD